MEYCLAIKRNNAIHYKTQQCGRISKTLCWVKAIHRKIHTGYFHWYRILDYIKLIYNDRKKIRSCLELMWDGGRNWLQRDLREIWVVEIFYRWILEMLLTQEHTIVKTHPTKHILNANFTSVRLMKNKTQSIEQIYIPTNTKVVNKYIYLLIHFNPKANEIL